MVKIATHEMIEFCLTIMSYMAPTLQVDSLNTGLIKECLIFGPKQRNVCQEASFFFFFFKWPNPLPVFCMTEHLTEIFTSS